MINKQLPVISVIAAVGSNGEIGVGNSLPWAIKSELRHFREVTLNKILIVGKTTFMGLPPLRDRTLIVVSRATPQNNVNGDSDVYWVNNLVDAVSLAQSLTQEEVVVIGGASIYEQVAKYATKLYLTVVDAEYPEANVFFPIEEYHRAFFPFSYLAQVSAVRGLDTEPSYEKFIFMKR